MRWPQSPRIVVVFRREGPDLRVAVQPPLAGPDAVPPRARESCQSDPSDESGPNLASLDTGAPASCSSLHSWAEPRSNGRNKLCRAVDGQLEGAGKHEGSGVESERQEESREAGKQGSKSVQRRGGAESSGREYGRECGCGGRRGECYYCITIIIERCTNYDALSEHSEHSEHSEYSEYSDITIIRGERCDRTAVLFVHFVDCEHSCGRTGPAGVDGRCLWVRRTCHHSRRRDCHFTAPPSTFSRCFNRDRKGVSSK